MGSIRSSVDSVSLGAWRGQLAATGARRGLRTQLLHYRQALLPRFAVIYRQLHALPGRLHVGLFSLLCALGFIAFTASRSGAIEQLVLPYLSTGYRYTVVDFGALPGFEQPSFDDSGFTNGDAPFGSGGYCPLDSTVETSWPLDTELLLRKPFTLPIDASAVKVAVAIDNDIQVSVNGIDISGGLQLHEGCAKRDSFIFPVPDTILNFGGSNLLAVRARDRGLISYVDVEVRAEVPGCPATASVSFPRLGNRHRYPVTISGVTAPDGGPVTLTITSIFQDEPVTNPTGKTCTDGIGVGTAVAKVRNERLLAGDGRVYHIGFTATDSEGALCTGEVTVCVPAKEGEDCGDQGALFDSTACPAVIYSDRSAFASAAPALTTSTFDGLVGTPAYPQNYPFGPGYYTVSPSGITVDGVRYLGTGSFGIETYILGPVGVDTFYILNGTFDLLGGRTTTDIFLPPGVTAFGADFGFDGNGADGGSLTLTIFLRNGTTETALLTVAPQSVSRSQFFGYIGSAIERIQLDSGGTGFFPYTLLDNVSFGPP